MMNNLPNGSISLLQIESMCLLNICQTLSIANHNFWNWKHSENSHNPSPVHLYPHHSFLQALSNGICHNLHLHDSRNPDFRGEWGETTTNQ